jgi:hypothetical protein
MTERKAFAVYAGSSWRKAYFRLNHPIYSMPFFDALLAIKTFEYKQVPPSSSRISSKDGRFLEMVPTIARKSGIAFPHLEELAKHASKSKTVQFYTKDTCVEFHSILCLILRLYHKALKDMDECKAPDEGRFFDLILDIVFYGRSLHLLAYSTTNEMHLQVIQDSLQAQYKPANVAENGAENGTTAAKDKAGERDKDEITDNNETRDDDATRDEELIAVQPSTLYGHNGTQKLTLSQSFGDWMRLTVVNFEATDILQKYVSQLTSTPPSISISIIAAPHPDDKMLPWVDLLQHLPRGVRFDSTIDDITSTIYAMVHEAQVKIDEEAAKGAAVEAAKEAAKGAAKEAAKEAAKGVEKDVAKRAAKRAAKKAAKKPVKEGHFKIPVLRHNKGDIGDNPSIAKNEKWNSYLALVRNFGPDGRLTRGQGFTGTDRCEPWLAVLICIARLVQPDDPLDGLLPVGNSILHLHPSDSDFKFRLLIIFLEYPSDVAQSVHTCSALLYLHTLPTLYHSS